MNNFRKPALLLAMVSTMFVFSSCINDQDPGPMQSDERDYEVKDFDRLEIGDAMNVTVEQGAFFTIHARGDHRNIHDLEIYKEGNTLVVKFDEPGRRSYDTYITITMPTLMSAHFSGATNSEVSGFSSGDQFEINLSGASISRVEGDFKYLDVELSGASSLSVAGSGTVLKAELSGASLLDAFPYAVGDADLEVSGGSNVKVSVSNALRAAVSGASVVTYRGTPSVASETSDSSTVVKD